MAEISDNSGEKKEFEFDPSMIASAAEVAATRGRIIAVDFGDVRTGIAFCDRDRILASGYSVIRPGGIDKTVAETARIALEEKAVAAVVGLPRNMNGSEGFRADRCREFAGKLHLASGLPVMMTDERLTTVVASHYLNETNTRGKDRKKVIDALSAEIILQDTLEKLKHI